MTELECQNAIDQIIGDGIAGIDIVHDNEQYAGPNLEWLRVSVLPATGKQKSMGDSPTFRYYGVLAIQIFTKPNTGSGRALEISDMITSLLRAKRLNGIQFFVPTTNKVGVDLGWYQVNVLTEFYRED